MQKVYELSRYVKFKFYTVNEFYVLQLFEASDNLSDTRVFT